MAFGDFREYVTRKIGKATAVYQIKGDELEIASIRVPQAHRGRGDAGRAMQALVEEADSAGLKMKLVASPLDARTRADRLVAFYRRYGFEVQGRANPAGDPWMMRPAKKSGFGRLPKKGRIPAAQVQRAMKSLGAKVQKCKITPALLREGMEVEREHRDVTHLNVGTTARIAASHICERRDYYKRIKRYVEPRRK
jgi:GNAT superfamily N-acetyltransferase